MAGFIFSWISGALNSVFAFLLLNLIGLHIYLMCKGMSTYEFIVAQREQEKKKAIEESKERVSVETKQISVHPEEVVGQESEEDSRAKIK